MGSIDAVELGRLVRTSVNHRISIAATITKCATMLKKDPEEIKTCVDIIEMCTEILEIADRNPPTGAFPFMRLPLEVRDHILNLMIKSVFRTDSVVSTQKRSECKCPKLEHGLYYQNPQMKALPALLGPPLSDDFFRIFFRDREFRFKCTCDLYAHLKDNERFRSNIKSIKVHWCGPESAKAYRELAKCPRLEAVTISISKSTLSYLNERASLMRSFFPLSYRSNRLSDALGLDELLEVRGIHELGVVHTQPRASSQTFEMERANLLELLSTRLLLAKET